MKNMHNTMIVFIFVTFITGCVPFDQIFLLEVEKVQTPIAIYTLTPEPTSTPPPTPTSTPDLIYPTILENGHIYFSENYLELSNSCYISRKIIPSFIILHTDGQSITNFENWSTYGTFRGLGSTKSVHFAVCQDDILQMLPMFETQVLQAIGTTPQYSENNIRRDWNRESIQIEMCGCGYNTYISEESDEDFCQVVEKTTENTIRLVVALMVQYKIPIENIIGHYQIQNGKTDPGNLYLDQYFLPKLKEAWLLAFPQVIITPTP